MIKGKEDSTRKILYAEKVCSFNIERDFPLIQI